MYISEAIAEDAQGLHCSTSLRSHTSLHGNCQETSGSCRVCYYYVLGEISLADRVEGSRIARSMGASLQKLCSAPFRPTNR